LLILTAALLGGAGAFTYSYAPLHRAKDWEITYLEERLASRTEQVETLEAQLRQAEGAIEGQPSGDQLDALQAQLGEAQELSRSLQTRVSELEGKLTKMTRSRDSWKKKHASLVAEAEATRAAAERRVATTPPAEAEGAADAARGPADGATPSSPPAAFAPSDPESPTP
jgi:chromosome segregation ATPase